MTDLILKAFIKKKLSPDQTREAYGTVSSIVGIITNFILAIIKFIAGILSMSLAITADAFNNLSDAGSSLISLFSFKISSKPADRDHPFGHARMEYIASMVVSFLILLVGFEMLIDSIGSLTDPDSVKTVFSTVSLIILGISIVLKLWLGIFYIKVSRRINSEMLRAAATDCFTDTISTGAVLSSSIIIYFTDFYFIDAVVGIAVSAIILIAGGKILNETKNALLGEAPVTKVVEDIKSIVERYPEILDVHDMMVHNYGPNSYIASFHAEVDGNQDIYELHDTIDNVERLIKNELGILCTIHLDPVLVDDPVCKELKAMVLGIIQEIDSTISIHDFRIVSGTTHTNLIFDVVLPFECKIKETEIVNIISEKIKKVREDYFTVITVDRG